ncbi:hypothetical protein K1719_015319 [Acacia pycnantha]|nr:hypothetical protein K1719_015319 [Acacia pycnantha]
MTAGRSFLLLPLFLLTLSFSPTCLSNSEDDALLQLKRSFSPSSSLSSWVPNSSACSAKWAGVYCTNNLVVGLHLSNMALSGIIDIDVLLRLLALRSIGFVNNSFSGPIPQFNKLTTLKALFLTTNHFSGPIPSDFFASLTTIKKISLSGNNFSGNIPNSLVRLPLLAELRLEDNEFSGAIPSLSQRFRLFNVSNNRLEGAIPDELAKFNATCFSGNPGLCGKVVGKECKGEEKQSSNLVKVVVMAVMVVMVVVLIVVLIKTARRREGDKNLGGMRDRKDGGGEEMVKVHVPSSKHSKTSESSRKWSNSVSKKNATGDLVMVNEEKGVFGMPDLMRAAAEVLGNGGIGSAYKATMQSGLSVVVKRMREINKISKDSFHAEMRQFGRIRHLNILTPLAYHYRMEEKLIVSEYIPKGSLLYVLHGDRGTCHADLNWPTRLKIVKGIANALSFLHSKFGSHDLPHGNLKSSNVLLSDTYEPLLNDFAFHPLINPNNAPQALFACKTPDYTQHRQVSHKTDVYCLGIIILEIMTGKFPSQYHNNGKGGTDVVQWVLMAIAEGREAELIDPDIHTINTHSPNHMLQLLLIGASCIESNPQQRLNLGEAIKRIEDIQV